MIIVSSPLEALCHHQLYSKPSDLFTVYASLIGEKNDLQLEELQELIDYCKPENIFIATIFDLNGLLWSTSILGGIMEPRSVQEEKNLTLEDSSEIKFHIKSIHSRANEFNQIRVHLTFNDMEKGILMNENLFKYFSQINSKQIKEHPELENIPPFKLGKRVIAKHESYAYIQFPNKKEYLEILDQVFQHLRPLLFIKIERPELSSFESTLRNQNEEKLAFKELKSSKLVSNFKLNLFPYSEFYLSNFN